MKIAGKRDEIVKQFRLGEFNSLPLSLLRNKSQIESLYNGNEIMQQKHWIAFAALNGGRRKFKMSINVHFIYSSILAVFVFALIL